MVQLCNPISTDKSSGSFVVKIGALNEVIPLSEVGLFGVPKRSIQTAAESRRL
jgi:hypothetical protein